MSPRLHDPTAPPDTVCADTPGPPWVSCITIADLAPVLRRGCDDFRAHPLIGATVGAFYALIGLLFVAVLQDRSLLPLAVPLALGFALVGPFAAVGFYDISRRREAGQPCGWRHLFRGYRSPDTAAVWTLGLVLASLFGGWLAVSAVMLNLHLDGLGSEGTPLALGHTAAGWSLVAFGVGVGGMIAGLAFALSVVAFPLILDRHVDALTAAAISIRAVVSNPGPMAGWAVLVAALLALGMLPAFAGLIVVMPILGHATWHLYRRTILH
ncbi:MAG: DUF2189 domain-containing protein [Geminicoccaceae bacterium]|nr:MAG: DUF2189 domain-containing protein [Geminicoccaceae bacterium]